MARPVVLIMMGSDSDLSVMEEAGKALKDFDVPYEITISSAHRTPERTVNLAKNAEKRGVKVIIAGAGSAAQLAGFMAAYTTLPVIGVPLESSALKGLDSLLSTVQMPAGVPVATMAIGKAGARNAGLFAVEILALSDKGLSEKLKEYRKNEAEKVEEKARNLKQRL